MVRSASRWQEDGIAGIKPARGRRKKEQQPAEVSSTNKVPEKPDVAITFLHVGEDLTLPEIMVQSVRNALGSVEIIQMTDESTPVVSGVSSVVRKRFNGYLMTFRMEHLAALRGEWITLDTDVVVNGDITQVFSQDFDVALTKRYGKILDPDGIDIVEHMPYNTGVMFSRNHQFWEGAYKQLLLQMPQSAHKWWGDQLSVRIAADSGRFNVLELPCDKYNYTPAAQGEKSDALVIHYKGKRKEWMINEHKHIRRTGDSGIGLDAPG